MNGLGYCIGLWSRRFGSRGSASVPMNGLKQEANQILNRMQFQQDKEVPMRKYVFIMLTVVCCWIFCISVDVFAAGHGGGGGGGGRGHQGGDRGGYYGGDVGDRGGYRHHRRRCIFRNSPVDGYSCVWTGNNYKCCETWDEDDD